MNELKGKRILIFQQRNWGKGIGHFLATKLQADGCRLAALTYKKSTHKRLLMQKDVIYEFVENNDRILEDPVKYLDGDDFDLKVICRELGVDSIWPIVASVRNYVKSYGEKFYYGFKQTVSDEEMAAYVKAFYKYLLMIDKKFNPELIIAPNIISLPHIMFYYYFKKKGIKMLAVNDSKIFGIWFFTNNHLDSECRLVDRINELNAGRDTSQNIGKAKNYIKDFREKFIKPDYSKAKRKTFSKKVREQLAPYRMVWKWYSLGNIEKQKNTGITPDYRPPRIILRDHYSKIRYKRYLDRFPFYDFDKVKKFAYFPLQFQPEATIDVQAAFFSNQIETARQVAMSMPWDYTLVVKEHPAMAGLRPPSYIEKVSRTPNVKFIDYRIPSEEVIKKAGLIVSPNSTTIVEAAYYRKPAIQLGELELTKKLPNVYYHSNMQTLSSKIVEVLSKKFNVIEYEKQLENFVAAAYDVGYDFDYWGVWYYGRKADLEKLWRIYKEEITRILR